MLIHRSSHRSLLAAVLVAAALPELARATNVIVTITGTVKGGTDQFGYFIPKGTDFSGQSFTLVYTFDDTKGKQGTNGGGSVVPTETFITGTDSSDPGSAAITINGKSYGWRVRKISSSSSSFLKFVTPGAPANDGIQIAVEEGYGSVSSGITTSGSAGAQVDIYPASGTALDTGPDWAASFANSNLKVLSGLVSIAFSNFSPATGYTDQIAVQGYLYPDTITVVGTSASQPLGISGGKSNGGCPCSCPCQGVAGDTGATTLLRGIDLVGNPISIGSGNKFQVEPDLAAAPHTGIWLTRFYNSRDPGSTSFGIGWRSNWHRSLNISSSTVVAVTREDGRVDTFSQDASGHWNADPDVTSVLTQLPDNQSWQLVRADDSVETYTSTGQLSSVTTRAGLTTSLIYDSSGRLLTVTGPFGHRLNFAYDASNRISSVTGPDGGRYTYGYDTNGHLTSVAYPDRATRMYTYRDPNFSNLLTGIIDELGVPFGIYGYDAQGSAISTQHAGGADLTTVSYNSDSTVTVADALGNTRYYALSNVFGVAKPMALTGTPYPPAGGSAFSYDSNGFLSSRADFNGNVTNYAHDARGNETSRTEAAGTLFERTFTTTWDPVFHLPAQITESNRTTSFVYDSTGNLLTRTITTPDSQTRSWNYTYNNAGQVLTASDPLGNTTSFTYGGDGALSTRTDALGHQTSITRTDANGRPLSITDPNGLVTTLAYDARGRMTSRTAGTEKTVYVYDLAGNLIKVMQPDGSFRAYAYDAAHRLTGVKDSVGNQISYTLDAKGNRTEVVVTDAGGKVTRTRSFAYDAVNRLSQETGASGQITSYGYDPNGNLLSVTDSLNHATSYAYDSLNRRSSTTDAKNGLVTYGYDANDHLVSVTDPRGLTTTYAVDGLDNQTSLTSPDTGLTARTFDAAGNVLTSTDARQFKTTNTYDSLNRLTSASYADGKSSTYQYDQGTNGTGHLTGMSDPAGSTTWHYDQHGRVVQKQQQTGAVTLTATYSYDVYGRLSGIGYPSGKQWTLSYDGAGRVNRISGTSGNAVNSVAYMPFGAATGWTQSNGVAYKRTLDQDGRIGSISVGTANTQTLTWDSADRLTALTETGLAAKSYSYDELDRLTGLTAGASTTTYSYDPNGNRTQSTSAQGVTNYTYAPTSNQLLGRSGAVNETYTNDPAGNLLSDGVRNWAYDARGRMASVNVAGAVTNYGVNGIGQRIVKFGATEYLYDESGHVLGEYDAAGKPIEETIWLGETPVAVLTGTQGTTYSISADWLGAPHLIANSGGQNVWAWDHLAFGDNGPNANPAGLGGTFTYILRFPGQVADAESGLEYNMARDFSSFLGRYVESDPVGVRGGVSTYHYAMQNPVKYTDQEGLCIFILAPIIEGALEDAIFCAANPICRAGALALAANFSQNLGLYSAAVVQNNPLVIAATTEGSAANFAAGLMCGTALNAATGGALIPPDIGAKFGGEFANQAADLIADLIREFGTPEQLVPYSFPPIKR